MLKKVISARFLIYLVGMVIFIEHTICRVLKNYDNDEIVLKTKYFFVIK